MSPLLNTSGLLLVDANYNGNFIGHVTRLLKQGESLDLRGKELHYSVSGEQLKGCNFNQSSLRATNLAHADLRGTYLSSVVDIEKTFMRFALLQRASLGRLNLAHADIVGANFFGAEMLGCTVSQETPLTLSTSLFANPYASCHLFHTEDGKWIAHASWMDCAVFCEQLPCTSNTMTKYLRRLAE